ncbi:MAG: DUF1071 domain-containing protein [Candidatus Accumulibacter meliphilus]|uniref:DUF1071 domain-containing protein n=1 Tax=Candidatus Accumulibacter meliphilus TaxID=2211374 RepID=A0A369XM65_9PROT|nr:MAG: DUF1071 domain-containing protein [Candidatus Accumulibacter meliphilus]
MENTTSNPFRRLIQIDVAKHVEKKGMFSYLSWPFAVAQLRLADPTASWEVRRFDGLPYLLSDLGFFVEVAVTVEGVTLSQIHPVLDNKNRPILTPTPFDINTSIQRCLVKATGKAAEEAPAAPVPATRRRLRCRQGHASARSGGARDAADGIRAFSDVGAEEAH